MWNFTSGAKRTAAALIIFPFLSVCSHSQPHKMGDIPVVEKTIVLEAGLTYRLMRKKAQVREGGWQISSPPMRNEEQLADAKACLKKPATTFPIKQPFQTTSVPRHPYFVYLTSVFESREAAETALKDMSGRQCAFFLTHSSYSPFAPGAPLQIHVLEVDPDRFEGNVISGLAKGSPPNGQGPSLIAKAHDAIAAINGGFFVVTPEEGIVEEPAGISVVKGEIVSEPVWGRPALAFSTATAKMHVVVPAAPLMLQWSDGGATLVDGVNRGPGKSLNCGNPGDSPTALPEHGTTCTDDNELIVYNEYLKESALHDIQFDVVFDAQGNIAPASGGQLPEKGFAIRATGAKLTEIMHHLELGHTAHFNKTHTLQELQNSLVDDHLFLVNGGPSLIRRGQKVYLEDKEGWAMTPTSSLDRALFVHKWVNMRHPRTAAGISRAGTLLFVTVDGRKPGLSAGATIEEMRSIMMLLGAVDAINLDGGGSSAMIVNDRIVSVPSDEEGERSVADAILILPARH